MPSNNRREHAIAGQDSTSLLHDYVKQTSNAIHSYITSQIGGERNTSSSTNNYDVIQHENNGTRHSGTTTATYTLTTSPARLNGVFIQTTLAGTVDLYDNGTLLMTLTSDHGVGMITIPGLRFETNVLIDKAASASANAVTYLWRAI